MTTIDRHMLTVHAARPVEGGGALSVYRSQHQAFIVHRAPHGWAVYAFHELVRDTPNAEGALLRPVQPGLVGTPPGDSDGQQVRPGDDASVA